MSLEAGRPSAFSLDQSHNGSCRGRAQAHRDLACAGPEGLPGPLATRDWPVSPANNMVVSAMRVTMSEPIIVSDPKVMMGKPGGE